MKRNNFILVLTLILSFSFLIASCNKAETDKVDNFDNKSLENNIGKYHNEVLAVIMNERGRMPTRASYNESVTSIRNGHMEIYLNKNDATVHLPIPLEYKEKSDILFAKYTSYGYKKVSFENVLDFFQQEEINISLIKKIENIFKECKKEPFLAIEQLERLKGQLSIRDNLYIESLSQTLKSSSEYWNKKIRTRRTEDPDAQKKDTEKDLSVIWADAAGALYGSLLGPVGSILEGAIFSSIAAIQ